MKHINHIINHSMKSIIMIALISLLITDSYLNALIVTSLFILFITISYLIDTYTTISCKLGLHTIEKWTTDQREFFTSREGICSKCNTKIIRH